MAFDLQPAMRRRGTPELGYGDPPVPTSPSPSGPTTGYRDPEVPHIPELPRGPEAGGNPGIGGGVPNRTPIGGTDLSREQWRDKWLGLGTMPSSQMDQWMAANGATKVSGNGTFRTPHGDVLDLGIGYKTGMVTPGWTRVDGGRPGGMSGGMQGGMSGPLGLILRMMAQRFGQPQAERPQLGASPMPQILRPSADINQIIEQAMRGY